MYAHQSTTNSPADGAESDPEREDAVRHEAENGLFPSRRLHFSYKTTEKIPEAPEEVSRQIWGREGGGGGMLQDLHLSSNKRQYLESTEWQKHPRVREEGVKKEQRGGMCGGDLKYKASTSSTTSPPQKKDKLKGREKQ